MTTRRLSLLAFLTSVTLGAALAGGACGDSTPSDQGGTTSSSSGSSSTTTSSTSSTTTSSSTGGTGGAGTGGGGSGGGGTGGAPDCYPTPTTYLEIINACTTAQKVDVTPTLPLLQPDGGLPPLPVTYALRLLIGAALASVTGRAAAQTAVVTAEGILRQEERVTAAEDRLRRQDEQIARVLRTLDEQAEELRRLRALLAAEPAPPVRPFPWEEALRAFRLSGFVQADAVFHRQSSQDEVSPSGQPLNQDRFVIPRAHLRLDAEKWMLQAALELEASTVNGPAFRAVEASLSFRWQGPDKDGVPLFTSTLGLFKIPFGFEVPELDPHRLFLERSTAARALFPGTYDLGFRVQGGYRFLRYAFAVMNGEPIGEQSFPGRDPSGAKDLVGRIGADAAPTSFLRIRAGVSALTGQGFHQGTPATKDVLVWRDANGDGLVQITEIQVIPGAPATPSQGYHRFALGADLAVTARLPVLGDLTLYGEVVRAQNLDRGIEPADPVGAGRDLRELGFYAGATAEITRYAMLGVRYDRYDPDADASEQRGVTLVPKSRAYSTVAVTGAARYPPGRLIFEYDHNTNNLGRTAGGIPTTLADDAFTLRGEVTF